VERLIRIMARFAPPALLLAFLLALAGCAKKSDPLAVAQLFLQQVAAGQTQAAYQSAAFGFQAQRNSTVFEQSAREMGLVESVGANWEQPQITGREAKIPVTVQTKEGKQVPLIITLTKESSRWQVYSLRSPPNATGVSENRFALVGKAPTFTDSASQPAPPEADLRQLVRNTLLLFNEAVATNSFDAFYDATSLAWQTGKFTQGQGQLTKGMLQREFKPFVDKKIDISGIKTVEPVWTAPITVGTDGLLTLAGYFPMDGYRVNFSLKYVYELPTWKLFGIDVNLQK
jgi:hypothetical protein